MSNNDLYCSKCKGYHHPVECPMEDNTLKVLEHLQKFFNSQEWNYYGKSIPEGLAQAIADRKALQSAEMMLGKKKEKTLHSITEKPLGDGIHIKRNVSYFSRYSKEDEAYNQMHDIAKPIVAKLQTELRYAKEQMLKAVDRVHRYEISTAKLQTEIEQWKACILCEHERRIRKKMKESIKNV